MKYIILKIEKFINEYTSGPVLFIWVLGGLSIATFIFFFRDYSNIDFNHLKYVIVAAAFWIVLSDIFKKRGLINKHVHFVLDSIAYLSLYGLIVYYTGGYEGGLFFLFFLATVSAPLFGNVIETVIFLIILSAIAQFIHYYGHVKNGQSVDIYISGVIALQSVFYFIIAGVNKYFLEQVRSEEKEKNILIKKLMNDCQVEVKMRTDELKGIIDKLGVTEDQLKDVNFSLEKKITERTTELERLKSNLEKLVDERTKELEKKIEEMRRFQELAVGRELKMIELKQKIQELENNQNRQ